MWRDEHGLVAGLTGSISITFTLNMIQSRTPDQSKTQLGSVSALQMANTAVTLSVRKSCATGVAKSRLL